MMLFLFRRIDQVSGNYHPEGGLVIVAYDRERAQDLIAESSEIQPTESDWDEVIEYELMTGHGYQPAVYVFPDAGCC